MLLLLYFAFRGTDFQSVWAHAARASIPGLLLAAALQLAHFPVRALRWRTLLEPVEADLPFASLFEATVLGFTASAILPGRVGEILRPALLASRKQVSFGPALGSIVTERLLDVLTVLAFFAVGIASTPLSGEAARHAAVIRSSSLALAAIIFLAIFVLLLATKARRQLERRAEKTNRVVAWLIRALLELSQGAGALRRPELLATVAVQSVLMWGLLVGATWTGIRACGVEISLGAMLVMLPLIVLGVAIPTPAGAGGYHAALTFGLSRLFAVGESLAVSASILSHFASIVPLLLLGSILFAVSNVRLRDLRALIERDDKSA